MSKIIVQHFIKYLILSFVIAGSFWFYFQLDTYPLKVARWAQPFEAKALPYLTERCEGDSAWLKELLDKSVNLQGAYSVQVAHINADGRLYECSIGYKDHFFGEPINSEHRYRYASVSKLITVAAILNLVDRTKLNLDDRVVNLFPEFSSVELKDRRVSEITIKHLLNHRAGFDRTTLNGDPMFSRTRKPWCPSNLLHLATIDLRFKPGERHVYSNEGFCLLGAVIERVAGEPYRQFLEREYHLESRNIHFADDYYEFDEVRYDFRYDPTFNDFYLKYFDFESASAVAGLSGSATALAQLLQNIHHSNPSIFTRNPAASACSQEDAFDCSLDGVYFYQPNRRGLALQFHQGYFPGVSSLAVIDSEGGVTVITKSGTDRELALPPNHWVGWVYSLLSERYSIASKVE